MFLVICGKSATGKSTVAKLLENIGYERLVSYTTRPIRPDEVDGIDYHFINEYEFRKLLAHNLFFEHTSYNVVGGQTWRYGTKTEQYKDNTVIVANPDGVKRIKHKFGKEAIVFLLTASNDVIISRQTKRKDDPIEANRRMLADYKDFKGIEKYIDFSLSTDKLEAIELAKIISNIYEEVKNE